MNVSVFIYIFVESEITTPFFWTNVLLKNEHRGKYTCFTLFIHFVNWKRFCGQTSVRVLIFHFFYFRMGKRMDSRNRPPTGYAMFDEILFDKESGNKRKRRRNN